MFTYIIPLYKLPLNKTGTIESLNCNSAITKRLLDLGLIPGTSIVPILISPFNEITAFQFRNTIISFRKEVSSLINVQYKK